MPTIEITILPNGQSRIETKGFRGSSCRTASHFLEQVLGKATDEQLTAEFHQTQIHDSHHLPQKN